MRMRKKKNGKMRLLACQGFLADAPEISGDDTVFLEIGAGKGGFATAMAERHPEAKYFAMERVSDCVTLAAERAKAINEERGTLNKLKFVVDTADNLCFLFENESIDGIFLNFSDPWSKKGYAKRRLTHRRYLSLYMNLLKVGGKLRFKTDNTELFDFTLSQIEEIGITPDIVTRDLHASRWNSDNIRTEYEENFASQGYKINMVEITKPIGFSLATSAELTREGRLHEMEMRAEADKQKNNK